MSSVILTNWTVYYSGDTGGDLQIRWTGTTGTDTLRELYSELQDLFDNSDQMDDGTPMSAQTPTDYTIGLLDAGETDAWFIDPDSIEHLTGGGLQTQSWTRSEGSNIGIVRVPRSGSNIVSGDVGNTITHVTDLDSGILLYVETNYLWVRPDTSSSDDSFNSTSGSLSCNGHTDSQTGAATSGERIWSNIYTLGTIVADTRLYVAQNFTTFTNFWGDGHLDSLFLVNDGFASGLIDEGLLTVYARQYAKLYDHYEIDVSSGGRSPVPLASTDDANNDSGYRQLTISSGTGTWNAGNYIYYDNAGAYTWATTTKKGVITSGGSGATPTLEYYLIGDVTSDFSDTDEVTEYDPATGTNGDANGDVNGAPIPAGPNTGAAATITVTFAGTSEDLNNGNGSRPYSVTIDCQQVALSTVYERLKYITRRGHTATIDDDASPQTIPGEQYQAVGDLYLPYDNGSTDNPFTEGETITGPSSFTGTLTSKHDQGTNEGFIIMRDCRGTTPSDNDTLTGGTSGHTASVDEDSGADPVVSITQSKSSPFGTFAGGKFFGARGVFLTDVPAADGNNYELIDSEGVSQIPPQTIALTVQGLLVGDRATMFRATGDNNTVDKTVFTSASSGNSAGDADFVVTVVIDTSHGDTPTTGKIRVVNNSGDGTEQRYRYSSWATSTFTFVTGASGSATSGSGSATLTDSAADFGGTDDVEVGDVIRNTSTSESGRVTEVTDSTHLETSGLSSGWTSGNNYTTNALDRAYNGSDTAYVPYIDQEATGSTASVSVTYVTDRYVTTRVRKIGILPFKVKGQVTTSGITVTAIRTADTIVNLPG
jgi:hypothetical protein